MEFIQDFKFGLRLHQKIATVFLLVIISYTVTIGAVSIYFLKENLLDEQRKSLKFQSEKFSETLTRFHHQAFEQLTRFTTENHLNSTINQMAIQGPLYDVSEKNSKPLNDFRKGNVFQSQYTCFIEMYAAKQMHNLSLFQLYLLSPHQLYKDIPPQLFISIGEDESSIHLFDHIGNSQQVAYYADTPKVSPLTKDKFFNAAGRIRFSGFDSDEVTRILSLSGFYLNSGNEHSPQPDEIPYRTETLHEKRVTSDSIVLRYEHVIKSVVFNPVSNRNEQTPVAIIVTEKVIDTDWLADLKRKIGSDLGFFQNGRLILSTSGVSDFPIVRKQNGIIQIRNRNYLSAICSTPFLNHEDGSVYSGVIIDTDYIFDTIWKIVIIIGCSILFLLFSSLLISRYSIMYLIGKPVNDFLLIVQNILEGDLNQRINVTSKDEIGFLGYVFNHMTSGIQRAVNQERNAYKKLEIANKYIELQRIDLKKKVRERTRELNDKNARLKKTVQQLDQSRIEAEAASTIKSEFIANISHEIRTPMNAIIGFAELMDRKSTDQQQKKYVQSIISGGKSLQLLIDDLLDLSKIEAGKMEIHEQPVSLLEMCKEIKKIFSLSIQEKGLSFIHSVDPDIPEYVLFDEIRLRQILFNLIGNAIKFTDQGYVGLEFKKISDNPDGSTDIVLTVTDTGIGIPPDQHTHVFEAFCQKKGQKGMGTGLGLTITRRLASMMRGDTKIDSNESRGTRFRIRFRGVRATSCDKPILRENHKKEKVISIDIRTELTVPARYNSVRGGEHDIAKLLMILKKELYGLWEQACDFFIMNDIAVFADTIIELGNRYQITFLSSWGSDLYNQATNFDMESLPATLNMYPELISEISLLHTSDEDNYDYC